MKRKLIRQGGGNGLTVYLPKKWTDDLNLKPGAEVEIETVANKAIISAVASLENRSTEVTIETESEPFIRMLLWNIYRLGYERIIVNITTIKQKQIIEKVVEDSLFGFEMTKSEPKRVILENVAEPSDEKHDVLLRRMFLMIKDSLDLLSKDCKSGNFENSETIEKYTAKTEKYDNFCRRSISKKKFSEEKENFYWGLYNYLLLCQHSINRLYIASANNKEKKSSSKVMMEELFEAFDTFYGGYFAKDMSQIMKSNAIADKLYKKIYSSKEKTDQNFEVFFFIGESARLIYLAHAPAIGILYI